MRRGGFKGFGNFARKLPYVSSAFLLLVLQSVKNLVFPRGFSGKSFASLINRARGRARPDSAKPTSRPKLLAQNRLAAKRSGAPKSSEGGLDSVGFRTSKRARFSRNNLVPLGLGTSP
jgi:hypothetical protein